MSEDFAGMYRSSFEAVYGRPPARADGIGERELVAAENRLGGRLPEALRAFYLTVGASPRVTSAHNELTAPAGLEVEEGSVRFCDGHQSVCDWWVRLDSGDDPHVEHRMNGCNYDAGACSAFLRYFLNMQALMGGLNHGGSRDEDDAVLGTVRAEWEHVCEQEGLAIWQKNGMLIGFPEGSGLLFCAARTEEDRVWLESHFGFEF